MCCAGRESTTNQRGVLGCELTSSVISAVDATEAKHAPPLVVAANPCQLISNALEDRQCVVSTERVRDT